MASELTLRRLHDELGRMLAAEVPGETPVVLRVDSRQDDPGGHFDHVPAAGVAVARLVANADGDLFAAPREADGAVRGVVIAEAVRAVL